MNYAAMMSEASGAALMAWNGCCPAGQFDGRRMPDGIPGYRGGLVVGFRTRRGAESFARWAQDAFVQLAEVDRRPTVVHPESTGETERCRRKHIDAQGNLPGVQGNLVGTVGLDNNPLFVETITRNRLGGNREAILHDLL